MTNEFHTLNSQNVIHSPFTLDKYKIWSNIYPRGDSHMKRAGMLVVSFWGVIFAFWSHLRISWHAVKVSFWGTQKEIYLIGT